MRYELTDFEWTAIRRCCRTSRTVPGSAGALTQRAQARSETEAAASTSTNRARVPFQGLAVTRGVLKIAPYGMTSGTFVSNQSRLVAFRLDT